MTTWNTTQVKLNPINLSSGSKCIAYPGYQRFFDYTATGSETSVAITCSGNTDLDYRIYFFNNHASNNFVIRLNNDSTAANYSGYELANSGTPTAVAGAGADANGIWPSCLWGGISETRILTPSGLMKTIFLNTCRYTAGAISQGLLEAGWVYNQTGNITSLNFFMDGFGNFTAGTRIIGFKRVS